MFRALVAASVSAAPLGAACESDRNGGVTPVFWWRAGDEYALSLHAWEPFARPFRRFGA